MGALRKVLPFSFACFLIGSLALTAFPFTSGFFSKDEILLGALELEGVGFWLWLGGVIGAFFTGIYTFRLMFIVFFGENRGHHCEGEYGGLNMTVPLGILMLLSLVGGFIHIPVEAVFSHGEAHEEHHASLLIEGIMIAVPLIGIGIAYLFYGSKQLSIENLMSSSMAQTLHKFWHSGWGMDWLYDRLFVFPFMWLARINAKDLIDQFYGLVVEINRTAHQMMVRTQTGYLRWYALSFVTGVVIIVTLGVLL